MGDLSQIYKALEAGFMPDLDLTVDEWSDRFMVIPKSSGSNEYGPYKTDRTPHAREIMRCLSDNHPCSTVIAKVASQMFKTQICLNWFGSTVHQSPSNFLWLMPTGKLHKRIAGRIDKTIKAVDVLRERVAKPNSRDAMNNQDTKEYVGGTLFIATAGSAANLSEVPARRVAIDEVDRGEENVDGEGDPVKLAEARQTTFEHNRKSYYYSSPTIEDESRIDELFRQGTQRHALAECVHCGHAQELIFENLILSDNDEALYPCVECGGLHKESDKTKMVKNGLWSDGVSGGKVESFTASAMYLPYGWKSWRGLMRDYEEAKKLEDAGDESEMIVFYNTRLARCWARSVDIESYEVLKNRAIDYKLRTAPEGVLFLTAGVDTQDNRLAVQIVGWGRNLRAWIVDYVELHGDPANKKVWETLTKLLNTRIQHHNGNTLPIIACAIDTGGHRQTAVKNYVYAKRINCPIAIYGSTRINAVPLSRGSKQDINKKDQLDKRGVLLHGVGTVEIKNLIFSHLVNDGARDPSERFINFSAGLDDFYFAGVVSEKYDKKKKRYVQKPGIRNEPLDTLVYSYAALYHSDIRANRYTENDWLRLEEAVHSSKSYSPGKISLTDWGRG
jgi:phage terminase large subunit GpA-like protein